MGSVSTPEIIISDPCRKFMTDTLVWDNHQCMPLRPDDESFLPELERCKASGVDVVSLNVSFDCLPWENGIKLLATMRRWLKQRPDQYLLVERPEDILRARVEDKLAVTFDIEGGLALDEHLPMVQLYYDLGVRWMLLAYNSNNALAGGCHDKPQGLTEFGRRVVAEMERVGMVVCCSHTSYTAVMDIMEMATKPVIFSHSNPAGIKDHYRNVPDDAIRACARTGGVMCLSGIGQFMGDNDDRTETMVRHINYVADLVGVEHVGIGTDYVWDQQEVNDFLEQNPDVFGDEMRGQPINMFKPNQIPEVVEQLLQQNYSEADVRNIMGENLLRVFNAVLG